MDLKNIDLPGLKASRSPAEKKDDKFLHTMMQAPVGIIIMRGADMLVEMANDTYLQIVDRSTDQLIGKSLYEALPEVKEKVLPILSGVLETGVPYYGNEFAIPLNRFGKQEITFFNFVYQPLKEENDEVTGVMVVATEVTRQVKTRVALEQKDLQFRSLVNQSPIAMGVLRGSEFVIEMANRALLALWRRELSEVEGKTLLEAFPELATQPFLRILREVLDTSVAYKAVESVAVINSHDGSKKYYLDFEYSPLEAATDLEAGVMVTATDVTEKVLAREAIELAQKRYRDLLQTLPVAVFTVDKYGFLDLYNQAALELWAKVPERGVDKWCGSHGLFTLEGEAVPHEICPMATALKENRAIHTEAYVQRPDGSLKHVIAHPQPMHDSEGRVNGAMNVLIDITERKESETALRASEQKFRLLSNSMPQFIWTATPEGVLNYFSESVFQYSGLSEQQIFEVGWLDIVHPDERSTNVDLWLKAVSTGEPFHYEHRFRRYDGEYRWQLSRAVPQRDEFGVIRMWVGTSTDIHDKRLSLDGLKEKVEERTRELRLTNEHLVRSNNELVQFAYVASHDLQEPLRKIQAFVGRLLDTEYNNMSDKGKDYFQRVRNSANRTQRLIQDLLAFSKTNTTEKSYTETDLNQLLLKVREDLHVPIVQSGVKIYSEQLPTISLIAFQFEQLFTNILANAMKFARPSVELIIRISSGIVHGSTLAHVHADDQQHYYHISIADNGIGFEPQFSERIFMVFQRLHSREAYDGTGIGLAICKRVVENHSGYISAEGKPDEGAVFNIYLPVR